MYCGLITFFSATWTMNIGFWKFRIWLKREYNYIIISSIISYTVYAIINYNIYHWLKDGYLYLFICITCMKVYHKSSRNSIFFFKIWIIDKHYLNFTTEIVVTQWTGLKSVLSNYDEWLVQLFKYTIKYLFDLWRAYYKNRM